MQALGGGADDVEVAVQIICVQRCDREPPLTLPVPALRREDAVDAPLVQHGLDDSRAPVALGALAQDRVDGARVPDPHDRPSPDVEAEHRAVALAPSLRRQVQTIGPQLEGVPEHREAARTRQFGQRSGSGDRRGCRSREGQPAHGPPLCTGSRSDRPTLRRRRPPHQTGAADPVAADSGAG